MPVAFLVPFGVIGAAADRIQDFIVCGRDRRSGPRFRRMAELLEKPRIGAECRDQAHKNPCDFQRLLPPWRGAQGDRRWLIFRDDRLGIHGLCKLRFAHSALYATATKKRSGAAHISMRLFLIQPVYAPKSSFISIFSRRRRTLIRVCFRSKGLLWTTCRRGCLSAWRAGATGGTAKRSASC